MTDKIRKVLNNVCKDVASHFGRKFSRDVELNEIIAKAEAEIRQVILDSLPEVLARGYCSKRNSHKVLDPDLIKDMIAEVKAELENVK